MNVERLPAERHGLHRYARTPPEPEPEPEGEAPSASSTSPARRPEVLPASASFRLPEAARVFEELPRAAIVAISRPEAGDITPILLSYTIEFNYKQFRCRLYKKASQVLYLHFALKRREFLEEFHEKQEQFDIKEEELNIQQPAPLEAKDKGITKSGGVLAAPCSDYDELIPIAPTSSEEDVKGQRMAPKFGNWGSYASCT